MRKLREALREWRRAARGRSLRAIQVGWSPAWSVVDRIEGVGHPAGGLKN